MSTINGEFTKEQLIARINQVTAINKYRISRDPAADGLAMDNELFSIALASLEAEAVAWEWFYYKQWNVTNDPERAKYVAYGGVEVFPLYRRAAMLQGAEPDFREIVNSSTKHFRENAETSTKCWCRTCRPVTISDMRFVVCPECGNKRCPHANDHRHACTGSNEPGQEGSAYPAAPQHEVTQALAKGMERYGDAMQELAKKEVK